MERSLKLEECTILFDKCKLLNQDELMFTTFGPDRAYTIEKKADETLVFKVWDVFNVFEYKPKSELILKDAGTLVLFLVTSPEHYATNVFSGKLSHMDNWINFVQAFQLRKYRIEYKRFLK